MPSSNGDSSLDLSARHLQVLLTSLSSFDGKMMFLTALNVAGISALIGIALTADPVGWLFALSLSFSSLNVAAGLGRLWAPDSAQFPTPAEMSRAMAEFGSNDQALRDAYLRGIWEATLEVRERQRRLVLFVRIVLVLSAAALALTVATAVTVTY